jgi:hypothetical protein
MYIIKTSPLFNPSGGSPPPVPLRIPPSLWGCFDEIRGCDVLRKFSRNFLEFVNMTFFSYIYIIMKKTIEKVLREQTELPTTDIFHISMGENWDRGYDHKSDLFFKDYDKAVEYLISNEYEKNDYPFSNSNEERWSKGYGYQAKLTPQKLIV